MLWPQDVLLSCVTWGQLCYHQVSNVRISMFVRQFVDRILRLDTYRLRRTPASSGFCEESEVLSSAASTRFRLLLKERTDVKND